MGRWPDGMHAHLPPSFRNQSADPSKETRTSTLELFGDPMKYSGMSLSVGVTCGIATQLLLDGHKAFTTPGVIAPYTPAICDPIREKVEFEGVKMVERTL